MTQNVLDGQYPQTWDEYIGQDDAKFILKTAIAAAQRSNRVLGHVLLANKTPGLGKTALGLRIGQELRTKVWVVTEKMKKGDVLILFGDMKDGHVLLYDEIHTAGNSQGWMLHYLENGKMLGPLGDEPAPAVTVVGTTTMKDKLEPAVLDRFEMQPRLVSYTDEQAAQIAIGLSRKIFAGLGLAPLHPEVALGVARGGSNRPRQIRRIVCAIRDLAVTEAISAPKNGKYPLVQALSYAGFTADGLSHDELNYLRTCYVDFRCRAIGEKVLLNRLGVSPAGLAEVETLLLDKGLLAPGERGRELSPTGRARARTQAELAA